MTPPDTYASWSSCLELFAQATQDEAVTSAMNAGSLSWTGGVAHLFSERVTDVLDQRLRRVADDISRDLKFAGDHGVLARALLDARHKLALLHRFSCCAPFPEALSALLQSQVRQYAERAQQSMEDTARTDRSGRLGTIVRNNSLLRYAEQASATGHPVQPDATANRRRRTFLA